MIEVQDIPQLITSPVALQLRLLQYGLGSTHSHITQSEPKDIAIYLEGQEDAVVFVDDNDDDSGVEHHDASAAMRNMGGNKRVTASVSHINLDETSLIQVHIQGQHGNCG
jgi:hypothetical protein